MITSKTKINIYWSQATWVGSKARPTPKPVRWSDVQSNLSLLDSRFITSANQLVIIDFEKISYLATECSTAWHSWYARPRSVGWSQPYPVLLLLTGRGKLHFSSFLDFEMGIYGLNFTSTLDNKKTLTSITCEFKLSQPWWWCIG